MVPCRETCRWVPGDDGPARPGLRRKSGMDDGPSGRTFALKSGSFDGPTERTSIGVIRGPPETCSITARPLLSVPNRRLSISKGQGRLVADNNMINVAYAMPCFVIFFLLVTCSVQTIQNMVYIASI